MKKFIKKIKLLLSIALLFLTTSTGWSQCWIWLSEEGWQGDYIDFVANTGDIKKYVAWNEYDDGSPNTGCTVSSVEGYPDNWVDPQGYVHWGRPGWWFVNFSCQPGCENQVLIEVSMNQVAYPVTGGGTVCPGNTATITLENSNTWEQYYLVRGSTFLYPSTLQEGTNGVALHWNVNTPGVYKVYAYQGGVEMQGTATVVNSSPPSIIEANTISCSDQSNTYTTEGGKTNYVWNVQGGTVNSGSGTNAINVTWNSVGSQSVSVGYSGCAVSPTVKNVTVNQTPSVAFSQSPSASAFTNTNVSYSTTAGQSNYQWSIPGTVNQDYQIISGSTNFSSSSVTLQWLTTGQKTVTVNYTSVGGCISLAPASVTTMINASVPAAPTSLIVTTVSSTQIDLTWSDNSVNETGFQVERSTSSGSGFIIIATTGANISTYSNVGLSPSTTYYYRVRAINLAGVSSPTTQASGTTMIPPPAPPSLLTATRISSTQIDLAWTDNSINETGFVIERSSGNGFIAINTTAPNVTSYSNIGLTPGTPYSYRVSATKGGSNSAYTSEASVTTITVLDENLNNLSYQYLYDARHRMTHKKVPGSDVIYMVYDNRDRLVMTQNGNQRSNGNNFWTFTKYDEFNRPIATGIKDTTAILSQIEMQNVVDSYYASLSSKPWRSYGETFVGASISNNVHGYTNKSYPVITTANIVDVNRYLSVSYYDNYLFRNDWPGDYTYVNDALTAIVATGSYTQPTSENQHVKDLVTGNKIKVLDGGITGGYTWLKSISYFDENYRVVQIRSDNYKGGNDLVSNLYDFTGNVIKAKTTHVESDITWTDTKNVSIIGNKLISQGNAGSYSGAISTQSLPANQDGWVECTISDLQSSPQSKTFGFSDTNNWQSIRYGFFIFSGQQLYVAANGTTTLAPNIKPGDILRVERTGSTINFKINGSVVHSINGALTSKLFVGAYLGSDVNGSTLAGLRSSIATTSKTITRRYIYDHANRLLETWHKIDTEDEVRIAYNEYNELGQVIDKKLHSVAANASDARQSIDYRYNIRGWLTSINNSNLTNDNVTNNDTGDFFGMNLGYETNDANLGSTGQFNGNITSMKWSNALGLGTTKELGYNFTYDYMNRLTAANSRMNRTNSWQPGHYDENGLSYDLQGNIKTLQRKDDGNDVIDNLNYVYAASSNQLQYVKDNATNINKFKGFADVNAGEAIDYTYDDNGNLTRDLNKKIGSSVTDNESFITYNFLNLPEKVIKTLNGYTQAPYYTPEYVQYVYDASGRKLAQSVVTKLGTSKITDYAGEFIYEQDVLKIINNEEGRVVVQKQELVYLNDGTSLIGTSVDASNGAIASLDSLDGESYIHVAASGISTSSAAPRSGITYLGGTLTVQEGDRFLLRAKGFQSGGSTPVAFSARINNSYSNYLVLSSILPKSKASEGWIEMILTVPTGATILDLGLTWEESWSFPVNSLQAFNINDIEIYKLKKQDAEYQYDLKDHLGNVRVTFTTKEDVTPEVATMEAANRNGESGKFLRYDRVRIVKSSFLFDHTNDNHAGGPKGTAEGSSIRLSGNQNEKIGLVKSLAVMPGDVIDIEVYAKYVDANTNNWNAALTTLMSAIVSGSGTVVTDGGSYTTNASTPNPWGAINPVTGNAGPGPKAFLTYIMFDKDFNPITIQEDPSQTNQVQLSSDPKEQGQDVDHEKLSATVTAKQQGYVYIYLRNDEETPVEVYFDDLKVTHTKSPVIAAQDYYPFGLTFNSYQRENSIGQRFRYNGIENENDLGLNVNTSYFRVHDPSIGRWWQIDPKPNPMYSLYSAMDNNPIRYSDPLGDTVKYASDAMRALVEKYTSRTVTTKNGKVKENKSYNEGFANLISALDSAPEIFNFTDDESKKTTDAQGEFSFDGSQFNVIVGQAKEGMGGGQAGLMFEEVFHANQFLNGETYFRKNNGKWGGAAVDLLDEYNAKKFALTAGFNQTFQQDGTNVTTQFGYISKLKKQAAMDYLTYGIIDRVSSPDGSTTRTVTIQPAYPNILRNPTNSGYKTKTVNEKVYAYPHN